MEPKAEPSNGVAVPKQENPTNPPQGPQAQGKGKFQQGGQNLQKKKSFPNRGGKPGNNQQGGGNNRGPRDFQKNEVIFHNLAWL